MKFICLYKFFAKVANRTQLNWGGVLNIVNHAYFSAFYSICLQYLYLLCVHDPIKTTDMLFSETSTIFSSVENH